jgi:TRAP-type C4-dicarboxylate transport system permease small subunit
VLFANWVVALATMFWVISQSDPDGGVEWYVGLLGTLSYLVLVVGTALVLYRVVTRLWDVTEKHREAIKDWYADLPERKN